jgi:hypothetical protein
MSWAKEAQAHESHQYSINFSRTTILPVLGTRHPSIGNMDNHRTEKREKKSNGEIFDDHLDFFT